MSTVTKPARTLRVTIAALALVFAMTFTGAAAGASAALAPVASSTPTVSGAVQVGRGLAVNPGSWEPGAQLTYQWYRNGGQIPGATAKTYKVSPADYKATLVARVTGTLAGRPSSTVNSSKTVPVELGRLSLKRPIVTGRLRIGQPLTVDRGTLATAAKFSYQWYRNGKKIKGAVKSTYKLGPADYTAVITVKVTARANGYKTATSMSNKTHRIGRGVFTAPVPKITGAFQVGKTVKVNRGTWTGSPSTIRYQWYANGTAVKGATKSSFTIPNALKGKEISVKVTGTRAKYDTLKRASLASVPVIKAASATTPGIIYPQAQHQNGAAAIAELNAWRATKGLPAFQPLSDPSKCKYTSSAGGSSNSQTPAAVIIGAHASIVGLAAPVGRWNAAVWVESGDYHSGPTPPDYLGTVKIYECAP